MSAPIPGWPYGLSRELAALYLGISVSAFDALVGSGDMPSPRPIGERKLWSRRELRKHFDKIEPELTDAEKAEAAEWEEFK